MWQLRITYYHCVCACRWALVDAVSTFDVNACGLICRHQIDQVCVCVCMCVCVCVCVCVCACVCVCVHVRVLRVVNGQCMYISQVLTFSGCTFKGNADIGELVATILTRVE